jgi:CheY-like chemotaxis protein
MMGHEAHAVFDGREALAALVQMHPDLALIDLGLPGLDGYEVARRARASSDVANVKLVAYSGYAQPEDVRRSREAGFDAHVAKPIDASALASLIAEHCAT